jgi:hypothetical protein
MLRQTSAFDIEQEVSTWEFREQTVSEDSAILFLCLGLQLVFRLWVVLLVWPRRLSIRRLRKDGEPFGYKRGNFREAALRCGDLPIHVNSYSIRSAAGIYFVNTGKPTPVNRAMLHMHRTCVEICDLDH